MMRLVLGLAILLAVPFACAQESKDGTGLADAPSATAAATPVPVIPSASPERPAATHRFWDRENVLLFSGVAAFRALDFASTKNFLARGRTEVLIPDDIVYNNAGFASLEAAATATSVGISYLFHRTSHHKMERWLSITHLSVTAFGDAHNYALKTHRPH
jgi:hypothetical protein